MRQIIIGFFVLAILLALTINTNSKNLSKGTHSMSKKETALKFVKAVTSQDAETVKELVNDDYIQYNPFLPTGLGPFIGLFPILKENNTKAKAIIVIEDGNYVLIHHLWTGAKPFGADEMVSFDILRFDEKGKIAEHWDAMTPLVNETVNGRTQTDGPTEIQDFDKKETNKALAKALVEDVLMGKNPNKITDYISAETYHQHNPNIKDGLQGIVEAVQYLTSQNNMFEYTKIHKVLGEGNFVLTVSEGNWNNTNNVFYDLFRIENGKIVEHWDVIQEIPTENLANQNGMFGF